jgi:FkbM family methyltransferase
MSIPERLRRLSRAISLLDACSLFDACHFIYRKRRKGVLTVQPKGLHTDVELRGGTSDFICFEKIFVDNEYASPFDISPKLIVDAGANIGLGALYFAAHYPSARIVAIEPESGNFSLLQRNCAKYDNIISVKGALWPSSGEIRLTEAIDGQPWSFTVTRNDLKTRDTVKAMNVADILTVANA